jgi:hypothetical protein
MPKQINLDILARMNKPSANPSGRVYIHKYGLDVFNIDTENEKHLYLTSNCRIKDARIWNALNHYQKVCSQTYETDHKTFGDPETEGETHLFKFIIGILWGTDDGDKMIDGFGFKGLPSPGINPQDWPGNPEIYSWTFKNGVLIKGIDKNLLGIKNITCGDGFILMAEEEKYRRQCKDIHDYIQNPPKINGLDLLVDVSSI